MYAQAVETEYTLFLIGDCGEPVIHESAVGGVLAREIKKSGTNTTVIYLGDNVYPAGIPAEGKKGRDEAEKILQTQVDWIQDSNARGILIPGNHDWNHWGPDGFEFVVNQQRWVDSLKNVNVRFLPRDGCPGPVEIPLSEQSVLIILDTQWLLHEYEKPGEESDCIAKDPATLMTLLEDALIRNKDKRIIVAGHHPVITYGDHGGVFTWKDHLFPLIDLKPNLYIPLPVIGSLYPLYRKLIGHPQDLKHPVYNEYSNLVHSMLSRYKGSIYVAGHEHALQHIVRDSVHYIVSGSGSKTTDVKKKKYARFVKGETGFVKLTLSKAGEALIEFWQADDQFPEGKIIHQDTIGAIKQSFSEAMVAPDFYGDSVLVSASDQYRAQNNRAFFLGDNYRDTWETPIKAPVFDIGKVRGGLQIIKKGGGQQTLSLQLADSSGREFTLRSIEKYPAKAVPEMLRGTFAEDLVQDQISASHPYGAIVIPPLAQAAGIYHTNPKVVYIPDDPRLGLYRKDFANTLALFEERPDEDWSDAAYFGNSADIINTSKVLDKLRKDADNQVDQHFVLRSRLFDLWIGDWDRHDDQWRWASYEDGNDELYKPVPRDRDQAFFVNEGMLPKIWSRKWALPKFEGFDKEISWSPGLSYNARHFDRTFLNEMEEEDWIEKAKELQKSLTDEVIENAIRQWPEPIFKKDGEEVIDKLKARRRELVEAASALYKFLAEEVDVTGSDKNEHFEIVRADDGNVHVVVLKIKKDGTRGKAVYDRHFKFGETKEIRVYGLGGEDVFEVSGNTKKSIPVRIIGGDGKDRIVDESRVRGWSKKTLYYDDKNVNEFVSKGETQDLTSTHPTVNVYDRKAFKYNRLAPLVYGNFNPDDGLFFGGGFLYQTEGFRKDPFKQRHIFLASVAPETNSYNFLYRGDLTDVMGKWGLGIHADLKSPNYVNNFFGMGNETEFDKNIDDQDGIDVDEEIDYYRFRFEETRMELYLKRKFRSVELSIGPAFQRIEVEEPDEDRFIDVYADNLTYDLYHDDNSFAGVSMALSLDKRNDPKFTSRGTLITFESRTMAGLDHRAADFSSLDGSVAFYHSFRLPAKLVFAGRIGGGRTFGNYNFYQAQILSGRTELRGYRKTRFYGDSKLYGNLEARLRLTTFRSYLFPASIGLLGFYDTGRVWYKDENGQDPSANGKSTRWHNGWGGGIWFTPFNMAVLSVEAGHSTEGTLGYVRLGYLF